MERHDTEQEFMTAFWKLYEEKPIEKISIQQLCRTAGYNRSTFYNHFTDIYDLRDQAVTSIFEPIRKKVMSFGDFRLFLQENAAETIISSFFLIDNNCIKLLFRRHAEYLIGEKIKKNFLGHIKEQLGEKDVHLEMIEIIMEYQISAALGVANYWLRQEEQISAQEMLRRIYAISSGGTLHILKAELDKVYGEKYIGDMKSVS